MSSFGVDHFVSIKTTLNFGAMERIVVNSHTSIQIKSPERICVWATMSNIDVLAQTND